MSVTETPVITEIPIAVTTETSTLTPVQLLSGLGGAGGSAFRQSLNQLVFVEFDSGQLSALNLIGNTKTVLGTGYTNPEDVKLSADGVHAYVTERSGNFVKVALTSANRSAATLVVSGLNTPQQMALDEAHHFAYVVEFAATGKLWQINLLTGAKTAILSTLNFAVGIVLSADLQYAYISEQTTGPDKGRVSKFQLSTGARQPIVTGMTNPFFLTWADAAFTSLYVPQRDPVNQITRIDVVAKAANEVSVVAFRPSSVALAGTTMLVCCDQVIESINLAPVPATDLLIGIGFIPFTDISQTTGLANTSADPGAHYPVTNVPFGGTLPIMINYELAGNDGAKFYRVLIDGVARMDSWTDDFWNGSTYVTETMIPKVIAGQPGYFPVRPISQLLSWLHPTLGILTDSTNLADGKHTITVQFVDSTGVLKATSTPLVILVNNQQCVGSLGAPTLNGVSADPTCGVLHYKGLTADPVNMPVIASQPAGFATYSFEVVKGVNTLISVGNPVPAASPVSVVASTLLGSCTVAGFGEYLYVAATINNGWSRQSQYDAAAAVAFVLTS